MSFDKFEQEQEMKDSNDADDKSCNFKTVWDTKTLYEEILDVQSSFFQ